MQKRFVTLIEMMIVMFLIAMITGVVAYNYRGSLDEGKAFKTKAGMDKLHTILSLGIAENPSLSLSGQGWKDYIEHSPLVKNADDLIKDGWGKDYEVNYDPSSGELTIYSARYNEYQGKNKQTMFGKDQQ